LPSSMELQSSRPTHKIAFASLAVCIFVSGLGHYCVLCWLAYAKLLDELHISWGHPGDTMSMLQTYWLFRTPSALFGFPVAHAIVIILYITCWRSKYLWWICLIFPGAAAMVCLLEAIWPISIGFQLYLDTAFP
jgi:hypothetical protein